LQILRLYPYILLARRSLLPVLAHPRFPALARRGIPAAEGQRRDLRVRNRNFLRGVLGVEPDDGFGQSLAGTAIEDVYLDPATVLAGNGYIAAIVESFFQGLAQLFFAGHRGNPAFQFFVGKSRHDLKLVRILTKWSLLL